MCLSGRVDEDFQTGVEHFECKLLVICTFVLLLSVKALLCRVCKISPVQSALESPVNLMLPRKEVGKTCHAAKLQQ